MDNEFEKQQPENQTPEVLDTIPQEQDNEPAGTVPQGNEDAFQPNSNYQQYNYQQNQQYAYGNTGYQTNQGQNYSHNQGDDELDTRPLSIGEWLLTILALCIPCCVGIVLYIIWAFSKKGNLHRRNYCRAALIAMLVFGVIYFVVMSVAGGALYSYMVGAGYGM